MNIESFREYCLAKPGVTESFPFDEDTLVFKVMGKMFALTSLSADFALALKCEPERAVQLREEHEAIKPGYHMNKKHWNTVKVDGTLSTQLLKELINHSYDLVVAGLGKKVREELQQLEQQ